MDAVAVSEPDGVEPVGDDALAGGDELVRPGETPGPGQIISSNDIAVAALARAAGAEARILPLARDMDRVEATPARVSRPATTVTATTSVRVCFDTATG